MSLLHISQRRAIIGRKWFTFIILFEKEYKWTEEKHDGCQCGTIRYCGGNVAQLDIGMHIAESRNEVQENHSLWDSRFKSEHWRICFILNIAFNYIQQGLAG